MASGLSERYRRCRRRRQLDVDRPDVVVRPRRLGRKNWLHVGSAKSGPKVAAILSVVESCRRLGVPVKEYLLAVLPGMNQRKVSEVAQLTPARWKPLAPDLGWSDGYCRTRAVSNRLKGIPPPPASSRIGDRLACPCRPSSPDQESTSRWFRRTLTSQRAF